MPRGVASAEQLAMMARVMEAYCERFSIPDDPAERDQLALEILVLFNAGFHDEATIMGELIKRGPPIAN